MPVSRDLRPGESDPVGGTGVRTGLFTALAGAIFGLLWPVVAGQFAVGAMGFEPAMGAATVPFALVGAGLAVAVGLLAGKFRAETGLAASRFLGWFFAGAAGGALACGVAISSHHEMRAYWRAVDPLVRASRDFSSKAYGFDLWGGSWWPKAQAQLVGAQASCSHPPRVLIVGDTGAFVHELNNMGVGAQVGQRDLISAPYPKVVLPVRLLTKQPYADERRCDPIAFLRARRGAPYDLAYVAADFPLASVYGSRLLSIEFHQALARQLAPGGVVVVGVRGTGLEVDSVCLGRILATLRRAYGHAVVLPKRSVSPFGEYARFLASKDGSATLDPAVAARRCSARTMPDGSPAPAVKPEDFDGVLDAKVALPLTRNLERLGLEPETLRSPRIFMEYFVEAKRGSASGAMLRAALAAPAWPYFVAPWFLLACVWLVTHTWPRGAVAARLPLGAAAFCTGLCGAAGILTAFMVHQAATGNLFGRLDFLTAAALAGAAAGLYAAARLPMRLRVSPRLHLAAAGVGFPLALLLSAGGACLAGGSLGGICAWLSVALLGLAGGLGLGALAGLADEGRAPGTGLGLSAGVAGLGAAAGSVLVAAGLLPALGPPVAFLVLASAELAGLGTMIFCGARAQ
jgi:hypothetical protein